MPTIEDEWEYEYDQDIFLLDVDLTSLSGPLRSTIPGQRPLDRPDNVNASIIDVPQQSPPQSPPIEDEQSPMPETLVTLERPFTTAPNSVQILDFHSHNPIISYQDEVYSCTWSDMIGTNMFFTPTPTQLAGPVESVDLVGTSRIRLIGHRANISVKGDENGEAASRARPGKINYPRAALLINNSAHKRQADFLDRLREAKRAKGRLMW